MSSVISLVSAFLSRLHPHGLAIVIMVTALCLAAFGGALMKLLTDDLPAVVLAWHRFAIYGAIMLPVAFWRSGRACLRPSRPLVQVIRGLLVAAGNTSFILGVAHVDLIQQQFFTLIIGAQGSHFLFKYEYLSV